MGSGVVMASALEQRGDAILRRLPPRARMVEVGVLRGALSNFLLAQHPGLAIVMVDNWLTTDRQPESYRATRDEHALHRSPGRVARHRADALAVACAHSGRARVIEASSVDAAAREADHSFDLVFLDADHSERGVRTDIAAWLPKVKPGGWIGGHDLDNDDARYDFSGVRRAVEAWCPKFETDDNFTWFARV